jgi:hypothetical protein
MLIWESVSVFYFYKHDYGQAYINNYVVKKFSTLPEHPLLLKKILVNHQTPIKNAKDRRNNNQAELQFLRF